MSLDTNNLQTTEQVLLEFIHAENGDEFLYGYFKAQFLRQAADDLFNARSKTELSQEDLAKVLKKRKHIIARWEANKEGKISLRNYLEFAFACGMVPRLTLVPFEQAKEEQIEALEEEIEWQKIFNSPESQKFLDCEVAKVRDEIARGECVEESEREPSRG